MATMCQENTPPLFFFVVDLYVIAAERVPDSLRVSIVPAHIKHIATFFPDTSDEVPDCAPLSLLKRQAEEVPPAVVPTVSSGTPMGRRGRLANLAATIGTWEDDLSHANIPHEDAKEKPGTAVPKFAVRSATVAAGTKPGAAGHVVASSTASSKYTPSSQVGLPLSSA